MGEARTVKINVTGETEIITETENCVYGGYLPREFPFSAPFIGTMSELIDP